MHKQFLLSVLFILSASLVAFAQVSDYGIRANLVSGEITALSEGKISVQTKDGPIDAMISAATDYKKIPPGEPSLKNAAPAAFADISVGDKVIITGLVSADKKTMPAKTVLLMTKSDLAQKQGREAEWKTRGVGGKVTLVDLVNKKINIEVRGMTGATSTIAVTPKDAVKYKRYAEGSAKYSDAKDSSLGEIKTGDMLRALGDKGADGTTFTAEEVLTGAFQTRIGVVKHVDAVKNEVVVVDSQSKKEVTIAITASTLFVKKYPAELAARFASMQAGAGAPGAGGGGTVTIRPGGGAAPQGGGVPQGGGAAADGTHNGGGAPRGGMGGQRGGGIDDMVERFPDIKITDLQLGDTIAVVTSSSTANADRVGAIKFLSGVEPFLKMSQAAGGGQRSGQGGQGGVNGNFNIPGLDGFGGP